MDEINAIGCEYCGATPDMTELGIHHSPDCPNRLPVERGELGAEAFRDSYRIRPGERRDPPDLLPLILLELRMVRKLLHYAAWSPELESYQAKVDLYDTVKDNWREEMKNLGLWDERHE